MAAVVYGAIQAERSLGQPPTVVGGLAVLSRLSNPQRATTDLDLVDRGRGEAPQLKMLRAVPGAEPVEPAAVAMPTPYGEVRIDVLEVRQVELDDPSDDPGDRLHASAHAWASDTATNIAIEVRASGGEAIEITTLVAEPGPLVAMKLQAIMDRTTEKKGTDLLDILRLTLDPVSGPDALAQIHGQSASMRRDIERHVDLWLVERRREVLRLINPVGGDDLELDDIDLAAELLKTACHGSPRS